MSGRKDSYSVNLRFEQIEDLRALSKRTKVPIAVHVREAIDRYLRSPILGNESATVEAAATLERP